MNVLLVSKIVVPLSMIVYIILRISTYVTPLYRVLYF